MKRFLAMVFALVMLLSNSGIALSAHYCHNMLVGINFYRAIEDCCDPEPNYSIPNCDAFDQHCCANKTDALFQPVAAQQLAYKLVLSNASLSFLPTYFFKFSVQGAFLAKDQEPPPPKPSSSIPILFQVQCFRI